MAENMQNLRKKKLINKDFQLRTIFATISISIITFFILITVVGINAATNNAKINKTIDELNRLTGEITGTVKELKEVVTVEDNIVSAFIYYSKKMSGSKYLLNSKKMSKDHNKNIEDIKKFIVFLEKIKEFKKYIALLKDFAAQNLMLIGLIFLIVLIQGIVLYWFLLKMTYRVSGPIYVMSQHIQDVMDGRVPTLRPLREKDEFVDFYNSFVAMVEKFQDDPDALEGSNVKAVKKKKAAAKKKS
ncbi:MAG: hypothetical protein GY754_23345 [bacterium]|nr:hypothetical protein [bacterium]